MMLSSLSACAELFLQDEGQQQLLESDEKCQSWNDSYGSRSSKVCEDNEFYKFEIAGELSKIPKREFQEKLRIKIGTWLVKHQYPSEMIAIAKLDVWYGSPTFSPRDPQMRVQLDAPESRMLFWLPFDLKNWEKFRIKASLLGAARYPSDVGYRAGELLVSFKPETKQKDISWLLDGIDTLHQGYYIQQSAVYKVSVPPLQEIYMTQKITEKAHNIDVIEQIKLAKAEEVTGEFVKGFEFTLLP
jgi:hypothetical protein